MVDVRYIGTCLYTKGIRGIEPVVFDNVAADITGATQKSLILRRETRGEGLVFSKPLFELRSPVLVRFFESQIEFEGFEQVDGVWYYQRIHLAQVAP